MSRLDQFKEAWGELSVSEQCDIFRAFQSERDDEERWEVFDDLFFETYFQDNAIEAVRAWHYGGENNYNDDYIKFNAYGNLETGDAWDVANDAECYLDEMYEYPELWEDYIELDDEDEEEGED